MTHSSMWLSIYHYVQLILFFLSKKLYLLKTSRIFTAEDHFVLQHLSNYKSSYLSHLFSFHTHQISSRHILSKQKNLRHHAHQKLFFLTEFFLRRKIIQTHLVKTKKTFQEKNFKNRKSLGSPRHDKYDLENNLFYKENVFN